MTEFTAGPWAVSGPHKAGHYIEPAERGNIYGYSIYSAGTKTVANATCDDLDHDTCKATVRLIASAPDLLAALEAVNEIHHFSHLPEHFARGRAAYEMALAAIAKARGE